MHSRTTSTPSSPPREIFGLGLCINGDLLTVNGDGAACSAFVFFVAYGVGKGIFTLRRIVFEKVSQHFGAGEIVDGNNLITFCTEHLTESQTADTTETVNSNFYHFKFLLKCFTLVF